MQNNQLTGATLTVTASGCRSHSKPINDPSQDPAAAATPTATAATINTDLKKHALAAGDWALREDIEQLHAWIERFNNEFDLGLDVPVLRLDMLPTRKLGSYRRGRNGLGLRHEICLNLKYLDCPLAQQLSTLLHELLHEWQCLYGKPSKSKSNYHNREFRQKARLYGLLIDERGHNLGIEPGRFSNLLAHHGVEMQTLRIAEAEQQPRRAIRRGYSKMKKYACACTIARCATELVAQCQRCGQLFQEAAPLW